MSKILIIAEKSEVAKAIKSAIDHYKYHPENEYRVAAASGHLMELKAPEDYDEKYKKWTLEDLPVAFPNWEEVPKKDNDKTHGMYAKKFQLIEEGLKWCDQIIHAGDPDDEGQLIVDELLSYYKNRKPVYRLDVNDSTEQYIIKMMDKLTDNKKHVLFGKSAYARTVADALFGFNYSRYFTLACRSNKALSVGRVQTPTLGLVVNRDRLIEGHVQQSYYTLNATATTDKGVSFPVTFEFRKDHPALQDGKVLDKSELAKIIPMLNGKKVKCKIEKKQVTDYPPLPFNLVELQTYCNKQYGYSPEEVHNITQNLRSNALITYNRSSCQYLHEFQHAEAPGIMTAVMINLNIKGAPVDYKIKSKCFNDKYLVGEPHHAIIPTQQNFDIKKLTEQERNVYSAVCLYYMIQFMEPRLKEQTNLSAPIEKEGQITAVASKTTRGGYFAYMNNGKSDDEKSALTDIPSGTLDVTLSNATIEEKKTRPPSRYTQATLIKDMTSVAKYVQDPVIKQMLIDKDSDKQKENGSIGTPATRDSIVAGLITRGFLKEEGSGKVKKLVSTELGRAFYDLLPDSVKSLDTTAEWWSITEKIKQGAVSEDALYNDVLSKIKAFLASPPPAKAVPWQGNGNQTVLGTCPKCGGNVVSSKYGAFCSMKCGFVVGKIYGKELTDKEVKSFLAGKAVDIKGLKSKDGEKYNATFVMKGFQQATYKTTDGTDRTVYQPVFERAGFPVVGKCPKCGEDVLYGPKGAYCSGKCGMYLSNLFGKVLTQSEVKSLLAGKATKLTGLVRKSDGSKYDTTVTPSGYEPVTVSRQDGTEATLYRWTFKSDAPSVIGTCPKCSGEVLYGDKGAYCKNHCGFTPGYAFSKLLSKEEVTSILKREKTTITGLKNDAGNTYNRDVIMTGVKEYNKIAQDGSTSKGYTYEFQQEDNDVLGKCPHCGADVMMGYYGAYCSAKCGLSMGKIFGQSLDAKQIKSLLAGKQVLLKGLTSKDGKKYDINVEIDGTEPYSLTAKDGSTKSGFRLKLKTSFPEKKK